MQTTNQTVHIGSNHIFVRILDNQPGCNIVFLHGIGASSRYWQPLARNIKGHNLYMFDLPGFGKSTRSKKPNSLADYANVVHEFLDHFELQNVVLVGNSFGCQILFEYIQSFGQQPISKAVLIGPTVYDVERYMPKQFLRVLQDIPQESIKTLVMLALDYVHANPRQTLRSLRDAINDTPEDKLSSLQLPTLVIRGQKDKLVPEAWAEQITRSLPRGRLEIIPRSGHVTHATSYRQVAAILQEFIS